MKLLSGYDNRGVVYDAGDCIIRKINADYFPEIEKIYKFYEQMNLHRMGIVKTEIDHKNNLLKHVKHITTYPYEWTASMFKDGVLMHLQLIRALDTHGYTLKDALPGNIVFDFTRPVFVDFPSLLPTPALRQESWLRPRTDTDPRLNVFEMMFVPFMFIPLMAMQRKDYSLAREMLSERACNRPLPPPVWTDIYPEFNSGIFRVKQELKDLVKKLIRHGEPSHALAIMDLMRTKNRIPYIDFLDKTIEFIESIDVKPPSSGYASYYEGKNENFDLDNQERWGDKQKSIYMLLKEHKPRRLLDIGANTGWFSMLAEKTGAEVISTDIDELSIDLLYSIAKRSEKRILPLYLSFDDLTKSLNGVQDSDPIYEGRDFVDTPLFMSPTERIASDMVLCLGLVHHLVLGMGKDLSAVMKTLSDLTREVLVLEFIDINDPLILNEPSFFSNLSLHCKETYNEDITVREGLRHFKSVDFMKSSGDSRKLLIFSRK